MPGDLGSSAGKGQSAPGVHAGVAIGSTDSQVESVLAEKRPNEQMGILIKQRRKDSTNTEALARQAERLKLMKQ